MARVGLAALAGGSLLTYLVAFEQAARLGWLAECVTGALVLILAVIVLERIKW